MAVWPYFAALAVLAFSGQVLSENSPAVMMPGINSRSSSNGMDGRRRRPVRVTPSPDAQLPPNAQPDNLRAPIYFPPNLHSMYNQPAIVPLPTERRTPSMSLTETMDIEKLDIGHLRMLNSISTMEEFATMFGFEMPVAANNSGIAARFGSGGPVKLPHATCEPENKTVVLDLPAELNVVYIPTCVRLLRCGGCCYGSMLECRANNTEPISIEVMRVPFPASTRTSSRAAGTERGRQRPGSSGRGRRGVPEMITVHEVQHTECDCLCRIQEHHCNPALHQYVQGNCSCKCLNSDEEDKCAVQPMTHYWDHDQCTCFCLKTANCSVTLRFDHTTCSCVKIPQDLVRNEGRANNPRSGFVGDNVLDEESERFRRDRSPITFGATGRRQRRATSAREQRPHA